MTRLNKILTFSSLQTFDIAYKNRARIFQNSGFLTFQWLNLRKISSPLEILLVQIFAGRDFHGDKFSRTPLAKIRFRGDKLS